MPCEDQLVASSTIFSMSVVVAFAHNCSVDKMAVSTRTRKTTMLTDGGIVRVVAGEGGADADKTGDNGADESGGGHGDSVVVVVASSSELVKA